MKIELPENIDLTHPDRYTLTFCICRDQFSFSLYNPMDDGSCFYKELDENKQADAFSGFKDTFFENDFFLLPFRKVRILNNTAVFTYIPDIMYQDKHKKDYLDFLFSEVKGKILSQSLPTTGITILHLLHEEIYNFFVRIYTNPEFIHHSAPLIAYFRELSNPVNAKQMIVNRNGNGIDIFCFSQGALLQGNHFPCNQIQDAIYYILFVWKQLQFDQKKDFLHLAGNSDSKKELSESLKPHIHNILPVNIVPETHFDQAEMQNIPFELAALSLCEL
jgi:hypothetical protein